MERRHCEVIKYLVSKGININTHMEFRLPLTYVSQSGHHLIVEYLIKEGAAIDHSIGNSGSSALYSAIPSDYPKVVQILIENGVKLPDDHFIAAVFENGSTETQELFKIALSADEVFNKTITENELVLANEESKAIFAKRLINLIYQSETEVNNYKGILTEETFSKVSNIITELRATASIEDAIRGDAEDIYSGSLSDLVKDPAKLTELR